MSKKHEVGTGWAVVTGASSGLGAIFAVKLAERGLPISGRMLRPADASRANAAAQ
jgi:NADP-dependent 3-hydroxy acid dehydrogenase YdfG